MIYKLNTNNGFVVSFEIDGVIHEVLDPVVTSVVEGLIATQGTIYLKDGTIFSFNRGGGTSSTTGGSSALLSYIFTRDKLFQGTELTESDDSIPNVNNNKGFLTSTSETALLDFYKAFAYNDDNYKLIINSPNVEVSFLCSDRRYGVAGSRRAWSPYFKIRDLEKTTFTLIQNDLVGSDLTAAYNIQGKITRNAAGVLFITLTDTHAGSNLFGAVLNIRHRVV